MYANRSLHFGPLRPTAASLLAILSLCGLPVSATAQQTPLAPLVQGQSVVRNLAQANERIEMTVNTSQVLTLSTRIPRLVVNNPELVTATPLSETEIQIAARKPGVTQINLWDENGQIFTVDLLIFGDVRELEMILKQMYPQSSIKVTRLTNSLVLNGQVDRPEIVSTVFRLAEDYAPKVVSDLTVGGVQQVILKVKVMEVSRNRLRQLGVDFSLIGSDGAFSSGVSGILGQPIGSPGSPTVGFSVIGDPTFSAFIDALQQSRTTKILADPTLVTVSGRAARFQVGGQIPVPVPQTSGGGGQGGIAIEYKDFGTIIDFVPLVLSNGRIRLEVRPDMSELDYLNAVNIQGTLVPGLKRQLVDTGVEMNAGQTLAIAGLIQERIRSQNRGLPYVSNIPVLGIPFRRVSEEVDEIESLVLVTPDFADAMDPHEVPPCGPGMETMSPTNGQLYGKGFIEVPACGPCGASEPCVCTAPGLGCQVGGQCGPAGCAPYGPAAMATDGAPAGAVPMYGEAIPPAAEMVAPTPADPAMPTGPEFGPQVEPVPPGGAAPPDPAAQQSQPNWQRTAALPNNRSIPHNPTIGPSLPPRTTSTPGLIGPIGYDVAK